MKALSPRVFFVLVTFGASNSSLFDRRQYLLCSFVLIRSLIYTGDKPCIDLNIITNILNSILNLIGSQCNVRNTGVIYVQTVEYRKSTWQPHSAHAAASLSVYQVTQKVNCYNSQVFPSHMHEPMSELPHLRETFHACQKCMQKRQYASTSLIFILFLINFP